MPQLVDVEGIGQVEFPDHYTPAMIQDYWKQNFQPRLQQEQRIQAGLEASRRPEDTPNWDALKSTSRQMVADPAIDIARGVVGVPETAVGLLDIPTMGYAGKALENIPYAPRFGETKQILGELYSPERKAAMEKVKEAKGFAPTLEAMVENPSTLVGTTLESLPSMFGGGALAQKGLSTLAKLGPRAAAFAAGETAPVVAGALGEGLVSAGQTAEQIREETPNRALTWDQAGLALASGALTGGIGVAAGKLAQALGIENWHTLMAKGKSSTTAKDLGERIAKGIGGAITEGFFEELPQSTQEQITQNIALGKPWDEGVGEQAAAGLLAGAAMGGVAGAFGPGHHAPGGTQTPPPTAGPAPTTPSPVLPQAPAPAPQVTPTTPATGAPPTRPSIPQGATQAQIGNAPQQESQSNSYWSEWQKGEPVPVKIENLSHFKNIFGLLTPEGQSQLISSMGLNAQDAQDLVSGKSTLTSLNAKLEFDLPRSYFSQDAMRSFWGAMRNRPEPAKPANRLTLTGDTKLPQATRSALASPQVGIDYASMSQDQWAKALSVNPSLADTRGQRGIYNALTLRPELRAKPYFSISSELAAKAYDLMDRIKSATGMIGSSTGWMYKNFGDSKTKNPDGTRSKAYLTVKNPIENLTPERMSELVRELEKSGYNGSVKTVQKAPFTAERLIKSFDNVVFHGKTQSDVDIAASIAQRIFGKAGSVSFGIDPVGTSHTDHLASLVAKSIGNRTELKIPERRISVQTAPIIRPEASMIAPQQAPLGIQRGPVVTPEIAAAAQQAVSGPSKSDLRLAAETNQQLNARVPVAERGKAIAERMAAALRIAATIHPGDIINGDAEDRLVVKEVLGDGSFWVEGENGNEFEFKFLPGHTVEKQGGIPELKRVENAREIIQGMRRLSLTNPNQKAVAAQGPAWKKEMYHGESQNATKSNEDYTERTDLGPGKYWTDEPSVARYFSGREDMAGVTKGKPNVENPLNFLGDWMSTPEFAKLKKLLGDKFPNWSAEKWNNISNPYNVLARAAGGKAELAKLLVEAGYDGIVNRGISGFGDLPIQVVELSKKPAAPAEPEYTVGSGVPYAGRIYRVLSVKGDKVHIQDSAVGGEKRWVSKGQLKLAQEMSRQQMPEEAPDELPIAPAQQFGRGDGFYITQKGLDIGEGPFSSRDEAAQFAESEVGGRVKIVEVVKGKLTGGPKRATVGRMIEAAPDTPASTKDPNIGRTWNSPYGNQTITGVEHWAGKDHYQVTDPSGAVRMYDADDLEQRIKQDQYRTTPEYAKEQDDKKEIARMRAERDARQAEKKAKSDAEIAEFTKSMTPMAAAKAKAALEMEVLNNGVITTRKRLIDSRVADGARVVTENGERILENPSGSFLGSKALTKTGLDYAEYLIGTINELPTAPPSTETPSPSPAEIRPQSVAQETTLKPEAAAPIPASQLTPAQRATAEGQKKMASEAASVATVLLLNEKVRQKSPSEAWDAKQIHAATGNQSMLNSIRDDLLPIYNRLYAKAAPEAAAPVLTPEEKLIAERSTPRPGTPERAALDAKWNADLDAAQAAYEKSSTLRDQAKAAKYGSKVKEKLEAQATKAADEYARLKPAADEARTARQQAGIEDLAEQNIPIASDYAKRIAEANRTRTAPENPSARKKNWERANEKEQIAYDIALEELEKAYLDRGLSADDAKAEAMSHASALHGYPVSEGARMIQRLDRMAEVVKEQREKNKLLAEFDAIENPVSGTQKDRLRDRVESKYGTLEESRKALEEYRRLAAENVAEAKRSEDAAAKVARENVERNTAELVSQPTSKFSIKDYGTERLEPGRFASNSAMMVDLDAAIPKEAKKFTTQTSAARGTTPQKAAVERVWKPVTSSRGNQLVPAGYRISRATGIELSYYINPKDGGYWAIDRAVEGLIGRLFGEGLTIHQGAAEVGKTTPLVFFRGDKPVAVAMPFAHGPSTEIDAKAALGRVAKPSPQTITGSNVQTGTEMPVPPSAAPLTQGREVGGEPTAIDKSKPSQFLTKAEVDRLVNLAKTSPENAAQDVRDRWSGDKLSTRTWLSELKVSHPYGIRVASELKLPISAAAVDAYNINLPPGYVREGDLYVWRGEGSTAQPLTTDAAIKAIEELQKKIKGKQFSDPFLSTVWGPVALQVAKHLLRVGRPIEIAIREAIDKVRQQFPASNIDPQQAEQAIQTELATENEVLNAAERTKINRLEVDAAAEAIPHMASQQYADLESGYGTLEQAAFEKQQFRKAKSDLATLVNLADGAIRKLPDDRRHPDLYPKVTDGVSVTNGRVTVDDTFSNKLAALGVQHNPDNVKAMQAELYFEQLARKASDARERLQDLQDRLAYYQKIKAPDADIKRLQDLIAKNTTAASNAEAVALERNGADVLVGERTNELQQAEAKRMEAQAKVDALHIGPVAEFFGAGIAKLRNLFEKAKASAALIEELRKTTTDPEKLKALADEYRRYGDLPITIEKAIAEDSPLNQRQQDAAAAELQKALAEFNDARDEMNALLQQEEHTIIQQIEEAQKSFSKSANSVQENEALVQSALNAAKGDPALAHSVLAAAEINSLLNNVTAIANLAKHLGENLTQNRWLYDFLSGWRSSPGGSVTFSNLDAASLNVSPEVLQKVIDVASSSPSFASSIVALADAAAAAKAASVPIQLAGTLPSISDALKQGGKKGIDTAAQIASQFSRAVNPAITASRADNRQAARQINSLLTRLMALHHGANLFNNLAQSPQFQTLRQNIIVGSGGAPQQMIDRRPTGFTFREFGEAGKTPAHGEVILNVSEDPSSMERARKKMFAWFSAAEKYVAAYDQAVWLHALDPKTSKSPAELGFNESVARGLAAEIDVGRGEFLDQTFNRLKTTDSARKLMKLPLFRQHDAASRMVGGLVGAAMRSSLGRWVQGMMDSKRVMARFEDLPDLTSKALHSHYDPKNPKDNSYLNYDTYRKQVWNPMAHEGRKFDSDLKVGFQLPTGAIVTKEDIALLERSLVLNGMQRTEVSETNPLRGVHVTVGGKTYIRPSSSVGVFGMDRHLNRNANAFVADSTVAYRDTPGFDSSTDLSSASSNPVVQFWNNRNQMLIDHVVDSDRTDRKMKLDPAMQDAEKRLAALWKAGLETKPSNLAELVSQLATTLNPMAGVNPVSYVTERLNSELLNYQKEAARIQQERNDESTKNTGLKIALSADNEFTKPAAQLELPSSLYDYGALTPGERIARQSSANHQNLVEYANSVRRAIEELQTRLKRYNDGKLSAKEAAENYGGNVSEMKDTLEILRAILKDFEAAFSVNDPSLAPTRLASEISKWAVSGVLALPTVNFRNMTGGQFLVYLSDIAMGITLNRLALWNAVANMPKGLARLAYVWANGTAKFVDKNLVRHGNALEKVVDVVADAALAPARMALKNPAISTAGWKAQLEQVKNLGYDTKQGWVDAMKAAWLQSALFTNREEQEWAARNPKLAAANRAALTAAKTINAFFGSIGVENSDQVLNSLNLASAAALEQRLTEVARQYGKRLEDSGHTVFDPSDPAFQLKPSEWTTGGNEQARDDALANARLLFQTSASAEGFQLEHALWKFYQDEKAGRPASIYTDRQREAVTRTLLAMMNASLPTNRASVGAGNPLWRSVLTLQGYPADAMMKLINVSFGGTRDRRVAATIGAKLPMLFGIAAMMVLAGAAADGASEYWKRRMQAIQSAQAGVLDKDFWENKDKMASGVGRFLASNMFYLGDFILGMQNQVQGGKGFDPASRVFLVSVVNALTQAVRESYATYSGAGPASHVVQPFIDFAARLTPGANEIRKLFGDNTYEQQAKNVSRAEARSLGMELPKTGAAPSAGPTTVARRFLASAVGEMEEARRKNDQVAYQKAFTKAQEEIGYLQEYYVKHRTELGDSPADAEKHAKQAVWRDYQEINPVVAALGGRRPTAAELQSITSGPTGERAEAQQRGMEAWQAGAQALFGKTGATTKEEVASSRGGGIPANLSVPATGGGGGGGSTGTISTGRGAPSRLRSVRLGRLALRPHQPQKGRLSLSSAGSRLPRPRATTFKRLSLSTHIA